MKDRDLEAYCKSGENCLSCKYPDCIYESSFAGDAVDQRERERSIKLAEKSPTARSKEAYQRAYYEANREEIAAKQRAYYEANREEIAAKQRAYREAHREKIAAYQRAYREANREEIAAYQRAYYEANREEIAAKKQAYREANHEEIAAYKRAYYEANREEITAYQRAYQPGYYAKNEKAGFSKQRRLRDARVARGWTQRALAKLINRTQSIVSRWEAGKVPWDLPLLLTVLPELAQKNTAAGE